MSITHERMISSCLLLPTRTKSEQTGRSSFGANGRCATCRTESADHCGGTYTSQCHARPSCESSVCICAVLSAESSDPFLYQSACESVTRHTTSRVETDLAFLQATANKTAIDTKWMARNARSSALDERIQHSESCGAR